MKTEFQVSVENIIEFAEALAENSMENEITGTTDDGHLLIDVHYTREDRDVIAQLEDLSEADPDGDDEE
jgi:hypothetical protein